MLLDSTRIGGYAQELTEALAAEDIIRAMTLTERLSALRCARILVEAPVSAGCQLFEALGPVRAAAIASQVPAPHLVRLMVPLAEQTRLEILDQLSADSARNLIDVLPDEMAESLMQDVRPELRADIELLRRFPADTAGSIMRTDYVAVTTTSLVSDVVEEIRQAPDTQQARTSYIYVVSPASGRLQGVMSLRDLLLADRRLEVQHVMSTDIFAVRADEPALEAAQRLQSRRLKLLPVVAEDDSLLGVITIGQAVELLAEHVADDFVSIGGGSPDESFFTPPPEAIRRRLPWMSANIFLNLGAVFVISSFEDTLVAVAILAAFLPMITDMGGNVGIQALSVSIRSIALGEARLRDFWRAVRKELAIGVFNGLALGALFCVLAFILQGSLVLGLVAGVALGVNVLVAGVLGGTMPFLIKRLGKDPAMMTGPILTTITDITGVSIYLGLCTLFLATLLAG